MCMKSAEYRVFVQQVVQADNKESSTLPVATVDKPSKVPIMRKVFPFHEVTMDILHYSDVEMSAMAYHPRLDCLLNRLFGRRSKKTSGLRTGLCEGNPSVTGGFPSQRTSNPQNVSFDDVIMKSKLLQSCSTCIDCFDIVCTHQKMSNNGTHSLTSLSNTLQ